MSSKVKIDRPVGFHIGTTFHREVNRNDRPIDPIIVARMRASRGMFLSLVVVTAVLACSLVIAPDTSTGVPVHAMALLRFRVAVDLAVVALVTSLVGMYFVIRYALLFKWPERFVDISK